MRKIKAFLIHLLGGLTVEESRESDYNSFNIGAYRALTTLRSYADTMYGRPSHEWCEQMYSKINQYIEDYANK